MEMGSVDIRNITYNLDRGVWLSNPPFGYEYDKTSIQTDFEIAPLIVDEEAAKTVQLIFKLYVINNYSLPNLLKKISQITIYTLSVRRLSAILRSKFYIGIMTYKGIDYKHIYPRLIDNETFNKAQEIINRPKTMGSTRGIKKIDYLYKHIIRCDACKDSYIIAHSNKYNNVILRCQGSYKKHKAASISESRITAHIIFILRKLNDGFDIAKFFESTTDENKIKILSYIFKRMAFTLNRTLVFEENENISLRGVYDVCNINLSSNNVTNIILNLCMTPTSMETILHNLNLTLAELQTMLFDMQLQDQIEEVEMGVWKTK